MNLAGVFYFVSFVQTRNFMENRIDYLQIENFKSIKDVRLDCNRVNVFIGEPNVGKSNILEAVSLLGLEYERNKEKMLSSFVRYEKFSNLFYDNDFKKTILINGNLGGVVIKSFRGDGNNYNLLLSADAAMLKKAYNATTTDSFVERGQKTIFENINTVHLDISKSGRSDSLQLTSSNPVKKFAFQPLPEHKNSFSYFLVPPHGDNLFAILFDREDIYEEFVPMFEKYGQHLVLDTEQTALEIQKNIKGRIYSYPYPSVADTLQRIIFYLTAIESNKDSVLIFEEPEAHAFPPYTKMLAHRIADDENNQYFLTTHSPYLLKTLIENTPPSDLNVSVVYYEEYQTKVHSLSEEHVRDILFKKEWDEDVFFNLDQLRNYGKQGSEILG